MCKKDVEGGGVPSLTLGSPLLSPAFFLFLLGFVPVACCAPPRRAVSRLCCGLVPRLGVRCVFFLFFSSPFLVGSCRRSCSCVLRVAVACRLGLAWPVGCACRCWRLGSFRVCACLGGWRLLGPARLRLAALLLGSSLGSCWCCACSCGVAPCCCRLGFARGSGRALWLVCLEVVLRCSCRLAFLPSPAASGRWGLFLRLCASCWVSFRWSFGCSRGFGVLLPSPWPRGPPLWCVRWALLP